MINLRSFDRRRAGIRPWAVLAVLPVLLMAGSEGVSAQIVESVGSRALGMGGAFVAVANDASATWWNPGALADGPIVDLALGRAVTQSPDALPARRDRATWLALGTPAFGLSYYRLGLTTAGAPTDPGAGGREEGQGAVPVRAFSASQIGISVVQSLVPGVHIGTTLKYVRGTVRDTVAESQAAADLLDQGEDLEGGDGDSRFDLDVGVLAVGGPVSVGALVRNVRRPEFGATDAEGGRFRLPRQVRVGAAFNGDRIDSIPLTVSLDADVRRYATAAGDRRVVAIGAEHWLVRKRVAIRGGGRFNTVGGEERAATGGLTVVLRSRFYLDGHLVRGGASGERGWGMAARVSF